MLVVTKEGLNLSTLTLKEGDQAHVCLKLTSDPNQRDVNVPVRVVALVDTSGSMLHYTSMVLKRPKIQIAKSFCHLLVKYLNPGDYFSMVTFANEPSVLFDIRAITETNRDEIFAAIDMVKCSGDSTNLSEGIAQAFKQLSQTNTLSKDVIVIVTDGDINAGITDANVMVELINSQKSRLGNLVSCSTVVTSGTASDVLLALNESFSSDPYIYLDGRNNLPEIEMALPVIMQKHSSAFDVFITVTTFMGFRIEWERCSTRYLRYDYPQPYVNSVQFIVYNVSDISPRNIPLALILPLTYVELPQNVIVAEIHIKYFNKKLEKSELTCKLSKKDLEFKEEVAMMAVELNGIRGKVVKSLGNAAECMNNKDTHQCMENVNDCRESLSHSRDNIDLKNEYRLGVCSYIDIVDSNLVNLQRSLEKSKKGDGHKWNRIVALRSEIDCESLGVCETMEILSGNKSQTGIELDDTEPDSKEYLETIREVSQRLADLAQTVTAAQSKQSNNGAESKSDATLSRRNTAMKRLTLMNKLRFTLHPNMDNNITQLNDVLMDLEQTASTKRDNTSPPKQLGTDYAKLDFHISDDRGIANNAVRDSDPDNGVSSKITLKNTPSLKYINVETVKNISQ